MNADRIYWFVIFAILLISTLILVVERNRFAIIVIILLAFCWVMFKYGGKLCQKSRETTKASLKSR